jgi:hypothetical protein
MPCRCPGTCCHPCIRHVSDSGAGACAEHATMPCFDQNRSITRSGNADACRVSPGRQDVRVLTADVLVGAVLVEVAHGIPAQE